MVKNVDEIIEEVWMLEDRPLRNRAGGGFGSTREDNLKLLVKNYLDVYHSDYRWMLKYYSDP